METCLADASGRLPGSVDRKQLAPFVLTTMEGAVMLARTYRSLAPYDAAVSQDTIENTILSFEPNRMLSIRVANPPAKFPFKNAIKSVWQVIRLEPTGPATTRLRITGLGYGGDEESRKLRGFFDKGNAYTLKKLQEKFAAKSSSTKPAS